MFADGRFSLLFVDKTRSLSKRTAPESCFIRVSYVLTRKHKTKVEKPARGQHSRFLQTSVKTIKKFYNIGPRWQHCSRHLTRSAEEWRLRSVLVLKRFEPSHFPEWGVSDLKKSYNLSYFGIQTACGCQTEFYKTFYSRNYFHSVIS